MKENFSDKHYAYGLRMRRGRGEKKEGKRKGYGGDVKDFNFYFTSSRYF